MKRLDLHPITYGIPSLQYTELGPRAGPRYSRGHAQTPPRMAQYVQSAGAGALQGGPSPPFPPLPPRNKTLTSQSLWSFESQVFGLRLLPRRGGFFILVCVYALVYWTFFFLDLKKKKRQKEKESKDITVLKYCLTDSIVWCSVYTQTKLGWPLLLFCWGGRRRGLHVPLFSCAPLRLSLCAPWSCLPQKVAWWWSMFEKKKFSPLPSPQYLSVPVSHSQPRKRSMS